MGEYTNMCNIMKFKNPNLMKHTKYYYIFPPSTRKTPSLCEYAK